MDWLTRWFGSRVELPADLARRARAWRNLRAADERQPYMRARLVVVDVETSGLDARRDHLLAIGAVAVQAARLRPGDGYHVGVRAEVVSGHDNILVHGITPQAQRAGMAPAPALMGFLEYVRSDVLVAYHAAFDRAVLTRALRTALGLRLGNPWIDLAQLAPAMYPEARLAQRGLDDWLNYFGLRAQARHRAAFDAFVSAELLLILLARARARGLTSISQLQVACERQAQPGFGSGAGGR